MMTATATEVKNNFGHFLAAVQMCCAKRINADFIVTRNIRNFVSSPVPAVKPSELLKRIKLMTFK